MIGTRPKFKIIAVDVASKTLTLSDGTMFKNEPIRFFAKVDPVQLADFGVGDTVSGVQDFANVFEVKDLVLEKKAEKPAEAPAPWPAPAPPQPDPLFDAPKIPQYRELSSFDVWSYFQQLHTRMSKLEAEVASLKAEIAILKGVPA